MKMIQNKPLTNHGNRKRPSKVRELKRFAKVEVFGDSEWHLVDLDMAKEIAKHRWTVVGRGHAKSWIDGRNVYLHRFVFGPVPESHEVDHIDRNRRNSRRSNLRAVIRALNGHNKTVRGRSKFRGVCWHKGAQKWYAQIRTNCQMRYLGGFVGEHEAARAYDKAAIAHYGADACVNFPKPKKGSDS